MILTTSSESKTMKHNKKQCRKCIYRGNMQGPSLLFCNYAAITDRTCLRRKGKEVIDIRGEDHERCELFEEGKKPINDGLSPINYRGIYN